MVKVVVQDTKKLADGVHQGTITRIEERTDPFNYIDIYIECEGIELKVGYPNRVTPQSSLGKLLKRFGIELQVGKEIDLDQVLKGKQVSFMTISEETEKGTFSRILQDSVKPIATEEKVA